MVQAAAMVRRRNARLIGPNCPGIITPEQAKVGIMPGFVFKPGKIGIVSKSGTLTYEAADQIVKAGLGISTAIGIGGDPVIGTSTREALELFMNDPETVGVVMIGEIGGGMEAEAARWLRDAGNPKPVVGFIAGQTAPRPPNGSRRGYRGWQGRYRRGQNAHHVRMRHPCRCITRQHWPNHGRLGQELINYRWLARCLNFCSFCLNASN